ncbi:MAG: STAS domain-containing protein [Deltaproteobacteria bacterium]|nr:STAS domain-containing protein [Deltaproteobacteria bacterium]
MEITTKQNEDNVVIAITGAVNTDATERLRAELVKIVKQRPENVVMDLSLVPTIGSAGIGKILVFYKELDKNKIGFEIKGIHENLYKIFKSIKLNKIITITK